jgi:hypothetical protein
MRGLRQALCWIMAFAVPVSVSATEGSPAMLSGSGDVRINGSSAVRSSAVYTGDRIATGENSNLVVSLKGTLITAPSRSSVVYRGADVELERGSVVVNTKSAMKGHLGNLTISPKEGKAKFQMAETQIAALEGSLNITDGVHFLILPAGQTLTRAAMNPADDRDSNDQPAGTKSPKSPFRRGIPGWVWGAAAAGVAAAAVAAVASGGSSPSPSTP